MSFIDFACNTDGMMNAVQTYQMDSATQTDNYIFLFKLAAAKGYDIKDTAIQSQIFNQGTLSFDELLPEDQTRLLELFRWA